MVIWPSEQTEGYSNTPSRRGRRISRLPLHILIERVVMLGLIVPMTVRGLFVMSCNRFRFESFNDLRGSFDNLQEFPYGGACSLVFNGYYNDFQYFKV